MSGQDDRELWEPLDAVSKRYQIEYVTLQTTLRDTTTGIPLPHGVKPSIMTSNQKRINLIPAHFLPDACMRYDAPSVVKICEVCASGHETRRCSGTTVLSFRMCPIHESQFITEADQRVLEDVRDFWKRKYDVGPLGWKLIRQLPPLVEYLHADGCMYGNAPDVVVGSVDQGVVGGLWWRDCTGVKVNARGQVLVAKQDEGWSLSGLKEYEMAGRCRWEMRRDIVLEGLGEEVFVGRMWDLNRKRRK